MIASQQFSPCASVVIINKYPLQVSVIRYYSQQEIRQIHLLQFKIQKEERKMQQYLTPLKEANQGSARQGKTLSQPREGDWVCYNCQNLNFSFRKKCNRCKVQTKEQNQHLSQYYYNYYPQECYFLDEKENFPSLSNAAYASPLSHQKTEHKCENTPAADAQLRRCELTPERTKARDQLPSVSPLVKRYNRHDALSTQESKGKGLFEDDCLWASIDHMYLEDPQKEEQEEVCQIPQEIEEIERIIQRIIL